MHSFVDGDRFASELRLNWIMKRHCEGMVKSKRTKEKKERSKKRKPRYAVRQSDGDTETYTLNLHFYTPQFSRGLSLLLLFAYRKEKWSYFHRISAHLRYDLTVTRSFFIRVCLLLKIPFVTGSLSSGEGWKCFNFKIFKNIFCSLCWITKVYVRN